MSILGIDLGGTKLAAALFTESGNMSSNELVSLSDRKGRDVGKLITDQIEKYLQTEGENLKSIGICIPGISRRRTGTVWAPNIPGWDDYPLLKEAQQAAGDIPVIIDSDRACYIMGEAWQGNAKGCKDAIFLAVGTGIGAGIMIDGTILRGAHDIAGAIGWLALDRPFKEKYSSCGCFEHHASGEGIAKTAKEFLIAGNKRSGGTKFKYPEKITGAVVFKAYEEADPVALQTIGECIEFWGMAVANLVSLFNPEKIILGGGVFGPGLQFISEIRKKATKWAQPISMKQVSIEKSGLGGDAGVYGAGFLALKNMKAT